MWLTEKRRLKIIKEIERSPARSAGIVTVALIEDMLTEAIKRRLSPKDSADQFLSYDGALGALGAKIELGFLLGLYDKRLHSNLKCLSRVRNHFAHEPKEVRFDRGKAKTNCDELQSNLAQLQTIVLKAGQKLRKPDPREHFFWCAKEIIQHLTLDGPGGTTTAPFVLTPSRDKSVKRPRSRTRSKG